MTFPTGLTRTPRAEELRHYLPQRLGSVFLPFVRKQLPRKMLLPTIDVGFQLANDCVAWALLTAMASQLDIGGYMPYAPWSLYAQFNNGKDGGGHFGAACKALRRGGVAAWGRWPYPERRWNDPVTVGTPYRIIGYRCLSPWGHAFDLQAIKRELALGRALVLGMHVGSTWQRYSGGIIEREESPTGGHAMAIIGYNDDQRCLTFQNSWGKNWGEDGFARVSYECVKREQLGAWAIVTDPRAYWGGRRGT